LPGGEQRRVLDQRLFREADRQLTICNACRYCEGLCPVFPALERRNLFLEGDVLYLANLCHDCRACMPACPYTAPHEFKIDIPSVMAEVRRETYVAYAFPRIFGEAFMRRSRTVAIFTLVSVVLAIVLVWAGRPDDLFTAEVGPGAFYRVVPWLFMLIPATVATAYAFVVMSLGLFRFWRDTDGPLRSRFDPLALLSATADVFALRQMRGGGPGCSYPEEAPSHARVLMHQLVFYGFLATFASTTAAAIYQEILGMLPPYELLSLPVVLGTVGGIAQVIGCAGLLQMKVKGSDQPATHVLRSLDVAFLIILLLANLTGLVLLAARETPYMGVLLAIHLGVLAGLFVTFPYSKFVHLVYRYAALVRNRQEERQEAALAGLKS
jgi:citrate/tricarballylate utilization protein